MLDVHRLVLLRELSARGTIAAVAQARSYSPSAVSQQLAQLQREAGVQLLRRSGRRLALTPAADVLVAAAGRVLDELERTEAELAGAAGADGSPLLSGTVRVAIFQSAALALLPSALRVVAHAHPAVRVEVVQHEPEAALRATWARDFDLVVAEQYPAHAAPHHPGLVRVDLVRDAVRLALPPAAASRWPVDDLATAGAAAWVMEPRGTASRHFAEQACRSCGFEPDVRFETADLQAQIALVESGNAVALLPDLVWTGRPTPARLVDLPGAPVRTVFTAQRRSAQRSPAVVAVREALAVAVAERERTLG